MIRLINRLTGTLMLVAPEREAEYLAAGHCRAAVEDAAAPASRPAASGAPKQAAGLPKAKTKNASTAAKRPPEAAKKKRG